LVQVRLYTALTNRYRVVLGCGLKQIQRFSAHRRLNNVNKTFKTIIEFKLVVFYATFTVQSV